MVGDTSHRVADASIPTTTPAQHNPNPPNTQRPHSIAAGRLSMDHPSNTCKQGFGTNPTSTPFKTQYDGNAAKGVGCQRTTSDEQIISAGCQRSSSNEHTIGAVHDGVGVSTGAGKAGEEHASTTTPSPFMTYNVEASADELAMFSMMGACPQDGCEVDLEGEESGEEVNGDEGECLAKRQLSKILCMMSEKPLTESIISHKSSKGLPPVMGCEDLNEPPERSDFTGWPDAPVLLRPSASAAPYQVLGPSPLWHEPHQQLQGNDLRGIEVETPLFKGRVLMLMNGLASTPAGVFDGKKRMSWLVVQGKFKQAVSFDELVSGQEFQERLENLPSDWFVEKVLLQLARKINSSMIVGPLSQPSMMSPVVSLAQVINVAPEGSAPDPFTAVEDMRLFDPTLVNASGNPMAANQRRKHYANAANRAGRQYSPDHVWTFHVWQQFVDMSKYQLDLGITRYSLTRHLAGQPLQFSFKHNKSGQHLFSFDIWHECLL